jgi:hypothetical protein
MKKDIVYSIRMAILVRDALKRAAKKERRTVASLLDKIILNYLEEQHYLLPHETGSDRRAHQRNKITLPAVTELDNGYNGFSVPCVITDIAMGGVNITYPKGSKIKELLLKGREQFRLSFKLPQNGEKISFLCDTRRFVEVNKEIHIGAMIQNPNPNDLNNLKSYLN